MKKPWNIVNRTGKFGPSLLELKKQVWEQNRAPLNCDQTGLMGIFILYKGLWASLILDENRITRFQQKDLWPAEPTRFVVKMNSNGSDIKVFLWEQPSSTDLWSKFTQTVSIKKFSITAEPTWENRCLTVKSYIIYTFPKNAIKSPTFFEDVTALGLYSYFSMPLYSG